MDNHLRQLERTARQTGSSEDMYAFFRAYRKIFQGSFTSSDQIPIMKTCHPHFYDDFGDFKAKIEFIVSRKRLTLDIACHPHQTLASLLQLLLGTSTVEATKGSDIDLSEEGSGTFYSRNSVNLFLTWDRSDSFVVPALRFSRHRYTDDCPKDILGMVMVANHNQGLPSPIIVEKDEPALLASVMPWVQSWLQNNYQELLDWELNLSEASFLHGEESIQNLENRLRSCQESIHSIQVALGNEVFHRMQIEAGIL